MQLIYFALAPNYFCNTIIKEREMIMKLAKTKAVGELGHEFNSVYPYLRIDFYKNVTGRLGSNIRQKVAKSSNLENAGIRHEGEIEINETMTVGQLEQNFKKLFGLSVQVSRKSGSIWLETTMSDNWTLKQQNDHGRELSEPIKNDDNLDIDFN